MSGVWIEPSSITTRCTTMSLFLKTTSWPAATVAGFGLNASFPPWPVIVIVTFAAGVDGDVGVPPPPPPQLKANRAVATASANVPGCRIEYPPKMEPVRRWGEQARYLAAPLQVRRIPEIYAGRLYTNRNRLRGPSSPASTRRW